jgi:hypothetical protein
MTLDEKLERNLCKRDCHAFIFGIRDRHQRRHTFLNTKDEHNPGAPIGPFPDKLYLRALVDCFLVSGHVLDPEKARYALEWGLPIEHLAQMAETGMCAIEKSRQMMVTWIVLAYLLWRAKYMPLQLILVQSKREDDAKKLVCVKENELEAARMTFMEYHLPNHLKTLDFRKKGAVTKCNIYFPETGSHVWGIPEGGSIIRSHVASVLFSDESAFQPAFGEAYRAALPAIHGGGQALFVSSAEVGEFQQLVEAER